VNADLPELLAERLRRPLPGARAQASFQPELAYGRHFGPAPASAREAAVLALVYPSGGAWHIPLTLRPENFAVHAGQISLPGGLIEPYERSEDAALRELAEELGTPADGVRLLGELSPIYLFVSNYMVRPWVASCRARPDWRPNAAEVALVLEVPLARLLDPDGRGSHVIQLNGVSFRAPCFTWFGHHIWGATSMILAELAIIVGQLRL
jgi:8-oxo-dGTP pyrophosphatase MutT (NUDIX family)